MGVNDIHKYKKAKAIVPELEKSLAIVEDAIDKLLKFKKFTEIQKTLDQLTSSRTVLRTQLKMQQRILQSKGDDDGN